MTTTGPTTSTGQAAGAATWASRRGLAFALRTLMVLAPVAASVGVAIAIGWAIPRPAEPLALLCWFAGIITISTVVLRSVDRAMHRFLPAVALLRISLVFPDRAPSRFRLALRSGTVNQLRRTMDDGALTTTPQSAAETLIALSATLGRHDRLTRGHSERVRAYSSLIADQLDLPRHDRDRLQWASLLHDIGKLDVPAEILNKDGRPTEDEWAVLQGHPAAATHHLGALADWLGEWTGAATQHHERWDGGGYPHGVAGDEISLAGRIVAVADAYDTMTSVRSYKTASTPAEARAEITRCSGSQFDPAIVKAFLEVSLRDLRQVMGPVSWIAQLPVLLALPAAAGPVVGGAVVASVTVAGVAATVPVEQPVPSQAESIVLDETAMAPLPANLAFVSGETADELGAEVLDQTSDTAGDTTAADDGTTAAPDADALAAPTSVPTPTPEPAPTPVGEEPSGTAPLPDDDATPPGAAAPTPTPLPATTPTPEPSATATPTPTPTNTPTPSPTNGPTPTPTPAESSAPPPFLYLTNPGSGDTTSSVTLPLSTQAPTDSALANYDTDRDGDEGLSLATSPGFATAGPTQRQTWTTNLGPTALPNSVQVRLSATLENYARGSGTLLVVIQRCDADLVVCESIGSAERGFNIAGSGGFKNVVTNVSISGDLTAAMPVFAAHVVALDESEGDVWLAYDTTNHDARIRF